MFSEHLNKQNQEPIISNIFSFYKGLQTTTKWQKIKKSNMGNTTPFFTMTYD